jgi:hypothetical protein
MPSNALAIANARDPARASAARRAQARNSVAVMSDLIPPRPGADSDVILPGSGGSDSVTA